MCVLTARVCLQLHSSGGEQLVHFIKLQRHFLFLLYISPRAKHFYFYIKAGSDVFSFFGQLFCNRTGFYRFWKDQLSLM